MADRNGTVPGTCGGLVIADNAITTPKIEDGSVTFEKLSSEVKEDITGWLSDDMEWTEVQKARARLNIGAISSTGSAIEDFTARNITATGDVNTQGDIVVGESGNAKATIEGSTGDITTAGSINATHVAASSAVVTLVIKNSASPQSGTIMVPSIPDGHSETIALVKDIPSVSNKATKVGSAVEGNFAGLTAEGDLADSGSKASDFKTKQGTVDSDNYSASGTGIIYIDRIRQDANGVITPHKQTIRIATTSLSGLMSSTDKNKLDTLIVDDPSVFGSHTQAPSGYAISHEMAGIHGSTTVDFQTEDLTVAGNISVGGKATVTSSSGDIETDGDISCVGMYATGGIYLQDSHGSEIASMDYSGDITTHGNIATDAGSIEGQSIYADVAFVGNTIKPGINQGSISIPNVASGTSDTVALVSDLAGSLTRDFNAKELTTASNINSGGDILCPSGSIVAGQTNNPKVVISGSTGDITTEGTVEAVDGIYVNRNDTACPALYVNNSNNKVLVIDRGGSNNLRVGNSDSSTGLTLELLSKDGKVALNGDSNKIVLSSKDLSNLLTLLGTLMSKTFTMTWNSTTKEYEFTAS